MITSSKKRLQPRESRAFDVELILQYVEKNTLVNCVKRSRQIDNHDDNTKLLVNSYKYVINQFKKEGLTAMMPFVTKLRWYMKVVCGEIIINTIVYNSLCKLGYKRKKRYRSIVFEVFRI